MSEKTYEELPGPDHPPGREPKGATHWVASPQGVHEIYTNLIDASWTLYDVRLRFAQLIPSSQGNETQFVGEERAALTLAWAEAKVLRDILSDLVSRYENLNGEIKQAKIP